MNKLTQLWHRAVAWHWTHKGETIAHCTYLGATFIEGHGIHAGAAGFVVVFVVLGMLAGGEH